MAEMPELVELHQEMADEGLRVQTVALDIVAPRKVETAEGVGAFAAERGFDLPIIAFDGNLQAMALEFEIDGSLPTTLAINRAGEVVDRQVGGAKKARFAAMAKKAME